jgi:hypothetical protein
MNENTYRLIKSVCLIVMAISFTYVASQMNELINTLSYIQREISNLVVATANS